MNRSHPLLDEIYPPQLKLMDIAENPAYGMTFDQVQELFSERHINGLDKITRVIGKRLFICKKGFEEWLKNETS